MPGQMSTCYLESVLDALRKLPLKLHHGGGGGGGGGGGVKSFSCQTQLELSSVEVELGL